MENERSNAALIIRVENQRDKSYSDTMAAAECAKGRPEVSRAAGRRRIASSEMVASASHCSLYMVRPIPFTVDSLSRCLRL